MEGEKNGSKIAVQSLEEALAELTKLDTEAEPDSFLPGVTRAERLFLYDELLQPELTARYLDKPRLDMVCRVAMAQLVFPKFHPPKNSGLASLARSPLRSDTVWGITVDIKGLDLKRLDRYKGAPNRYHRRGIVVLDRGDLKYPAATYVVSVPDPQPSKPSKELLTTIIEGAKIRNLPTDYIAFLEGLETLD